MSEELQNANWYYVAGTEYSDAFHILILQFDVLTDGWKKQIQRPSYYCAGLAIESFLKAYLTLEKVEFPNKAHKGHDLKHLISLDKQGLQTFFALDDADLEQIYILNERYYDHETYGKDDLRYGNKGGMRRSPHPDNLDRILRSIGKRLFSALLKRFSEEKQLRDGAGSSAR